MNQGALGRIWRHTRPTGLTLTTAPTWFGYPSSNSLPERRLSWWFNAGLLDFALLRDAGVTLETLRPGQIQP